MPDFIGKIGKAAVFDYLLDANTVEGDGSSNVLPSDVYGNIVYSANRTITLNDNQASALTIGCDGATNLIDFVTSTGAELVKITKLQVTGDLQVDGTTTTVNSTTVTIDDPIFTLGGDTAPGSDDNKDRGIEFRYYTDAAKIGFMGWDDSEGEFAIWKEATNTSEVFSGIRAKLNVGELEITGIDDARLHFNPADTTTGAPAWLLEAEGDDSAPTKAFRIRDSGVNGYSWLYLTRSHSAENVNETAYKIDQGDSTWTHTWDGDSSDGSHDAFLFNNGAAVFEHNVTANQFNGALNGTASLANQFDVDANNSNDETCYPIFVDGATGTQHAESDTGFTYNPSTGALTSTTFVGNIDAVSGDFDGTLEADAITIGGIAINTVIAGVTVTNATNATNAANVNITDNENDNDNNLITFIENENATGNQQLQSDGDFHYNPSTGTITATIFKGNIDAVDGDFDGTLEADAYTVDGTALNEYIADTVGNMVGSNTETYIAVTYVDSDNTLDFVIGTLNQDTTGNAATATALETARTIGGVSFDGTANINLPGVNTSGSQDTSGNADTATKIASITNSDIVQLTETQTLTNKTLTAPTLTTPALGTPASGVMTNVTGTATGLIAGKASSLYSVGSSTNDSFYIAFSDAAIGGGYGDFAHSAGLAYNPSSGILSGTSISLTTGITIDGTGGVEVKNGTTSAGFIKFFEDSNNGSNAVTFIGPSSTGDVTITLPATAGTVALTSDITGTNSGTNTGDEPDASASTKGIVELATTAETTTGTDAGRAVTPDGLKDGYQGSANVTTLGTITTGTWTGSVIADSYINDALTITGGTINNSSVGITTPSTGAFTALYVRDNNSTNNLNLKWNEDDTLDRTLNFEVNAGNRTIDLAGDITVAGGNLSVLGTSVIDQDVTSGSTPTLTGTNFTGIPTAGILDDAVNLDKVLFQEANDGGSTTLQINNSAAAGSTDETTNIDFHHVSIAAGYIGGRISCFRIEDFGGETEKTAGLKFQVTNAGAISPILTLSSGDTAETVNLGNSSGSKPVKLTTNSTSNMIISTNEATNSGTITIEDGANNNINLIPNGTGQIEFGGTAYFDEEKAWVATEGAIYDSLDFRVSNKHKITLTGNTAVVIGNNPDGPCNLIVKVIQADGNDTVSAWSADSGSIYWAGSAAPTLSTGSGDVDIITFYFDGTNYYGAAGLNFG